MTAALVIAVIACGVSWVLTGRVRRYALDRAVLDVPNHRSSHSVPTPRGGGLAIAAVVLPGTALAGAAGLLPTEMATALVGGGILVGGIGWIDDARGLRARDRFLVQIVAGAWAVWALAQWQLPTSPGGWLAALAALLLLAWLTNLYNFMDGIDGLAGGEAVTVGAIGAVLLLLVGRPDLAAVPLLIAAASAGFLLWNWAPAKIFMGDVGSGLLGFLFGVVALASDRDDAVPLAVWVLLLGAFVCDATLTLARRVLRGERWYEAHREHAYQRAVRAGWPHSRVTRLVLAVNCVLGALGCVAVLFPRALVLAVAAGAALLLLLYALADRLAGG